MCLRTAIQHARYQILAILALLCTGCFNYVGVENNLPDPFEFIESTNGCLGPWTGDRPLHPDAIAHNEQALKHLFKEHGIVHSDKDFCERFGGIPIHFVDAETVPCSTPGGCWGLNDDRGVHLERYGRSLAHELLHTYELEHWIFNTDEHPNWDRKDYYCIAREYETLYDPGTMVSE